ncbi:cation diffusion facilitator family transporter [Terribacillus sp. DMT04]|uniref:cation diffusion facilitator family transporter n=1 Tax=Terribacillus sp. DMT04 TaxID=2850441 RepID=UPI001C2C25F1|nr:cation diffusion facilitator family transporter [Terribacillus sp. DMT04]QXE01348.1 cation diffusion facilitator family transporter [Terribacillus sp. DMT04]
MGHGHVHDHAHGHHHHGHNANKKALLISFILTAGFMLLEAIGGFLTNSLALLSDAGHMLSDAVSLGVGLFAFIIGERVANYSKTYGYKRFEILAALFNGITLILVSLYIFYEAIQRFQEPADIVSGGMLTIAVIGFLVNIVVAWILMRGDTSDNLNIRAAFLHVIGDLLGSVGAIAAALLVLLFGWSWADPVASVIVASLVITSGWRVTKDAIHVLMEGTPRNVEMSKIIDCMEKAPGIISIHDLHVWSITSGQNALSCHAVVQGNLLVEESQHMLRNIEHDLEHLGIGHVTIQMETASHTHEESLMCQHDAESHSHTHAH